MNPTPVVFIPALLCDGAMYQGVIADLGNTVDAQVMLSPKPSLTDSAADILARAPEKFALVGTSYGGNLALRVALAAPERILALCVSGCDPGALKLGGPDLAGGLEADPDVVIEMLAGLVVKPEHTEAKATFEAMARRVGGEAGAAQARALATRREVKSRLGSLTMPTLVLWGEEDAIEPVVEGCVLADALPNAQFEVISGSGHLPTLEKPTECAALLRNFFSQS